MATLGLRVRFAPMRYAEGEAPAGRPRQSTPEEEAQREVNRVLREQIATNRGIIQEKAQQFACPLMQQAPRRVPVLPNGVRYDTPQDCEFLGVQAKKLAVASDGHVYDFAKITQYIRDNMHRQLRSPVTGEPMAALVYHTAKGQKNGKPVTMSWTPDLFASDEESNGDAPANAPADADADGDVPMAVD